MTSVVSDLLGQRITVMHRSYDSNYFTERFHAVVRGLAQESDGYFIALLEVHAQYKAPDGIVHLPWSDVPEGALVSITTKPGAYDGQVMLVVTDANCGEVYFDRDNNKRVCARNAGHVGPHLP